MSVDAPFSFFLGGVSLSVEGSKVVGVRKEFAKEVVDHLGLGSLRVAGKIIIVPKTC